MVPAATIPAGHHDRTPRSHRLFDCSETQQKAAQLMRWEINRPGKSIPVKQSADHFQTMAEATRAGKEALQRLLKLRINLFVRER
jgi:hypothetical protein